MKRHGIIVRIGSADNKKIRTPGDLNVISEIYFLDNTKKLEIRLHRIFQELSRNGLRPTEVAMDLLILATTVFCADTRIIREENSQDGWTREIDLFLPVSDPDLWTDNWKNIQKGLNFLTGDKWRIQFRARSKEAQAISPPKKKKAQYKTNVVSLFSGGLDSFVGAVDLLQQNVRPILVSHYDSAGSSVPQSSCHNRITRYFKELEPIRLGMYFSAPSGIFKERNEPSQRSRSFLFFALGVLVANSLSKNSKLVVPENGFISINVPLDSLRLGALTTRTTHPFFMARFQQMLAGLGIGVNLETPYCFKTKGEILKECSNQPFITSGLKIA